MHPRRGGWVLSKWETLLWHLNMPPPLPFCLLTEEQCSERGGVIRGGGLSTPSCTSFWQNLSTSFISWMEYLRWTSRNRVEMINPSYLQLEQIHCQPIRPSYDARRSLCKSISRSSQSSCSRETINRLHLPHACPSIQRINHPITVGPLSWAFQSKLPYCRARLHWTCLKLISIALCQASLLSTELHLIVLHFTST